MYHMVWVDLTKGTLHDDYFHRYAKEAIERYARMGKGQIFSVTAVKEETK